MSLPQKQKGHDVKTVEQDWEIISLNLELLGCVHVALHLFNSVLENNASRLLKLL